MALLLAHPIGEDHYSNMGFSILAAVVEQVSGQTWETYLREHVWSPLGMSRTGFTHFTHVQKADFAVGYQADKPQPVISDSIAARWRGLRSTEGQRRRAGLDPGHGTLLLAGSPASFARHCAGGGSRHDHAAGTSERRGLGKLRPGRCGSIRRARSTASATAGRTGYSGPISAGCPSRTSSSIWSATTAARRRSAPLASVTVKAVQAMAGVHPQPASPK